MRVLAERAVSQRAESGLSFVLLVFIMSATTFQQPELLGLFELDESGTILYSRVESSPALGETFSDPTGKNFFKEIAMFADADAMRKKLSGFRSGTSVAD